MRASSSRFMYEHIQIISLIWSEWCYFLFKAWLKTLGLSRWGVDDELNLASRTEQKLAFLLPKQAEKHSRDNLGKPDMLSPAWLHKHLAGLLTIHYVEYECQHRATGGGVWDMHGVFPYVQPERILIQHRLILQQIIQGDNPTWNEHRSVRGN